MMTAVITDDEVLARYKLTQLLQAEEDVQVLGEASSANEAIELVGATRPDLLFLDIHMPGMDGFDAITAISEKDDAPMPKIIFTTAYDRHAVKAFEIHAVDYLLKPYTKERLQEALGRARKLIEMSSGSTSKDGAASAAQNRLVFKSRGRIVFLPTDEIYAVNAEQNYVRLTTATENHMFRETITDFEARLDPEKFLRIHRSTIVNLRFAKEIRTDALRGGYVVTMQNGQKFGVSRSYRHRITGLVTV